jgi:methyl-accepting chemotaxis protein
MNHRMITLRQKFIIRVFSVLIIIGLISGTIQLYFMKQQIMAQTTQQADAIANNVLSGMNQTNEATKAIEHQIDLKLIADAQNIAVLLNGKAANQITRNELIKIRDDLGLAGVTIFHEDKSKDDIVGAVSTDDQEVGFSFKKFGYYDVGKQVLSGEKPVLPGATYLDNHTIVLPITQSGSHSQKPIFYKYAYYVPSGTNYVINLYIKADEVYNYTKNVGPAATINNLVKENKIAKEIAVLNPKVFADPSLGKRLYPPLKKIEAGTFHLQTKRDLVTIKSTKKESYIENVNGIIVYKMFLPIDENHVIYLALDYGKMSGPLYHYSIILIVSSLISLFILFFLTTQFFNGIYENIQKIIRQMKFLEQGDLTVHFTVQDESELESLSQSTNRMVEKLNRLVMETKNQAEKTQRLSVVLEAESYRSVKKMYQVSTEVTIQAREQLDEILEFLDELKNILQPYKENERVSYFLEKVDVMCQLARDRTAATTDTTIALSDLLKSLHKQSRELSDISNDLLEQISIFKL